MRMLHTSFNDSVQMRNKTGRLSTYFPARNNRICDSGISCYMQNDLEGFQASGLSFLKPLVRTLNTETQISQYVLIFQSQKNYF